jgi:hypothetical protein
MSSEPQRDIEKDLLAYKQRRREQIGAPFELHPATRKMLQSEAARAASRPLLTSEEAAKNFVRSFVMSHQQPSFFARHKQRILWGSGMFACLAVVLAVLRNDPQQAARQNTFSDALPAPPPPAEPRAAQLPPAKPQATQLQAVVAESSRRLDSESLARDRKAGSADRFQEAAKASGAAGGGAAPAMPRGSTVASGPKPTVQREVSDLRMSVPPVAQPVASTLADKEQRASAPVATVSRSAVSSENLYKRQAVVEMDKQLSEKSEGAQSAQVAKSLKISQDTSGSPAPDTKLASAQLGLKLDASSGRSLVANPASLGGMAGGSPAPSAAMPLARQNATAADGIASGAQVRQQFQQLDQRATYRQNFNSPPVPQVMQDFAFERTGDRVRIVDADGSTYEGTVMPAAESEALTKKKVQTQSEAKAVTYSVAKDANPAAGPTAEAEGSYRFIASGVNRKLKQSVEFRGEWQPAAPARAAAETPALLPASFGTARLETQAVAKKEILAVTNALSGNTSPGQSSQFFQQQNASSQGQISGRAVVGGRNEFDIKAVPK